MRWWGCETTSKALAPHRSCTSPTPSCCGTRDNRPPRCAPHWSAWDIGCITRPGQLTSSSVPPDPGTWTVVASPAGPMTVGPASRAGPVAPGVPLGSRHLLPFPDRLLPSALPLLDQPADVAVTEVQVGQVESQFDGPAQVAA